MSSGTTALHAAVTVTAEHRLLGDEVLVSAMTNIATALAVAHNGAVPVPVDSEATTWNLDLELIEKLITPPHACCCSGARLRPPPSTWIG